METQGNITQPSRVVYLTPEEMGGPGGLGRPEVDVRASFTTQTWSEMLIYLILGCL